MNRKAFSVLSLSVLLFVFTLAVSLAGSKPASAQAGDSWESLRQSFLRDVCVRVYNADTGVFSCSTWPRLSGYARTTIQLPPVEVYAADPPYGVVNLPVYFGLRYNPDDASYVQRSADITLYEGGDPAYLVSGVTYELLVSTNPIYGGRSSRQLSCPSAEVYPNIFPPTDVVNSQQVFSYAVMSRDAAFPFFRAGGPLFWTDSAGKPWSLNRFSWDDVESRLAKQAEKNGASLDVGAKEFGEGYCINPDYYSAGDIFIMGGSLNSSARGESTYDGYPAYRLQLSTAWYVYGRVTWSKVERYVEICDPTPTPRPNGSTGRPRCNWETRAYQDGGASDWLAFREPRWGYGDESQVRDLRTGSVSRGISYPVFQVQPLLQTP